MKKILFTWEIGQGLGHIKPIKQYAEQLRHCKVYVALRDLRHAETVFDGSDVNVLAAPLIQTQNPAAITGTLCYAELLHNIGFADASVLSAQIEAWQTLFDLVRADTVVFDHSPAALLAARGYDFKKIILGSGFICPPPKQPLGVFFPDMIQAEDQARIEKAERQLLNQINIILDSLTVPTLSYLGEIYAQVDKTLLTTVVEFDHFPNRKNSEYLGINQPPMGKAPQWPAVKAKRIYAYLNPCLELPWLLDCLKRSGQAVIFYSNNIDHKLLQAHCADNIHFAFEALDLTQVAAQCDFAIVNGNHETSCQLILSGTPLLVLPLRREQQIFARRVNQAGTGLAVNPDDKEKIVKALNQLATDEQYRRNATSLAEKYHDTNGDCQYLMENLI